MNKTNYCYMCKYYNSQDESVCSKGHKPRMYEEHDGYLEHKRKCEDYKEKVRQ